MVLRDGIYFRAGTALHGASRVCLGLGECAWTGAVDNIFGQPKPAK